MATTAQDSDFGRANRWGAGLLAGWEAGTGRGSGRGRNRSAATAGP
jgi:hypothetical protein